MDYLVGMIAFYSLINCDTQARPLEKLLIQKRNARRNVVANLAFQSYRGKAWDWTVTTGQFMPRYFEKEYLSSHLFE